MEGKEEMNNSGVTMKGEEAADSYRVVARVESTQPTGQFAGSAVPTVAATPVNLPLALLAPEPGTEVKKKRGRPRKYGADGKPTVPLSPMPISASIPLTGEFSAWNHGKGRSVDSFKKKHKVELERSGNLFAYSNGANFTPHVITVHAGEDVTMKIISFSQQGSRAICILSANGSIANVTLRQPNSSGGTLTYEGRFEILSLTGSFMPIDSGGTKSRSGGMSVSLAGPDGRVLGGGLAGLLIAAGPVQVVVASFVPGHNLEQKPKKQRIEPAPAFTITPGNSAPREVTEGAYGGPKPNLPSSVPFHVENIAPVNSMQGSKDLAAENNIPMSGGESNAHNPPNCKIAC